MPLRQAPATLAELLRRADELAGRTFADIAGAAGVAVPPDLRRAKGWPGELMERTLGAGARSRPHPDFEELGVELKTLPVDPSGKPVETTFVCTIPIREMADVEWEQSRVRRKLRRVLWLPIEGDRARPVAERRVGTPLLWELVGEDEADLKFDWEELAGLIGRGDVDAIDGRMGKYLQVRPKARDSKARRQGIDAEGVGYAVLPRGFYLRTTFTERLLRRHFGR